MEYEIEIPLGEDYPIIVNNEIGTPTYTSANDLIASVDSGRTVCGYNTGSTTISVCVDGYTLYCAVHVYMDDGIYRVSSNYESGYLAFNDCNLNTSAGLYEHSSTSVQSLTQYWKFTYIGSGLYTLRPWHNLNYVLYADSLSNSLKLAEHTQDSGLPTSCQWSIEYTEDGYVIRNKSAAKAIAADDTTYPLVCFNTYNADDGVFYWRITSFGLPPDAVLIYDTASDKLIASSFLSNPSSATVSIAVGDTKAIAQCGIYLYICDGRSKAIANDTIARSISWSSNNTTVITTNSYGSITGVSIGKGTILGQLYLNNAYYYIDYDVCVGFPSVFNTLIDSRILTSDYLDLTDDGLFLTTMPLSSILTNKGIYDLPNDMENTKVTIVNHYYDDWYIFAVSSGASVSYGLYKMREQEFDAEDGNKPGVTIYFIGLSGPILLMCLSYPTITNRYYLLSELNTVTGPDVYAHDTVIAEYFADTASDGPYLIAEKYISFLVGTTTGNVLSGPSGMVDIFNHISEVTDSILNPYIDDETRLALIVKLNDLNRIPFALEAINEAAGRIVYNSNNNTINLQNRTALTLYEKQAILACFTADISFNMFAAEVELHAEYTLDEDFNSIEYFYKRAIRADMGLGEEVVSGVSDSYYDPNSSIVQEQASIHGEY